MCPLHMSSPCERGYWCENKSHTHIHTQTSDHFCSSGLCYRSSETMGGWVDRVQTYLHIWTQIHKHCYPTGRMVLFQLQGWNLIISVAAKWNNVLSMLIASMINLLLFHCNLTHAGSLVIIPAHTHHNKKLPLTLSKQSSSSGDIVSSMYLWSYKDWFHYSN